MRAGGIDRGRLMSRFRTQLLGWTMVVLAAGFVPELQPQASACPSCKAANETDSRRPRAYMYSILFMLAMPATVFTGFGISFYRLSRRAAAADSLSSAWASPEAAPESPLDVPDSQRTNSEG